MEPDKERRYVSLLMEAESELTGPGREAWFDRLEREQDDVTAALQWLLDRGYVQEGLQLCSILYFFWHSRGRLAEGRRWLGLFLTAPGATDRTPIRAKALHHAGMLAFRQGDSDGAEPLYQMALALSRELSDVAIMVKSSMGLARLAFRRGDFPTARRLAEESLNLARRQGEKKDEAPPLHVLAAAARLERDWENARNLYERSLALNRELGDDQMVDIELYNLGCVELNAGNYRRAAELLRENLARAYERRDHYLIVPGLMSLGRVAVAGGNLDRAATLFAMSEADMEGSGLALDPDDRADYDRALAFLRDKMDQQTLAKAWARGRETPLDRAVRYAMES